MTSELRLPESDFRPASPAPGVAAFIDGKVKTLRELLAQMVADAEARTALSSRVSAALDSATCGVDAEMWAVEAAPALAPGRRAVLEERLLRLEAERRQEWVRCWHDLAALRVEARRTWREYQDLVQRVSLLLPYGRHRDEAPR